MIFRGRLGKSEVEKVFQVLSCISAHHLCGQRVAGKMSGTSKRGPRRRTPLQLSEVKPMTYDVNNRSPSIYQHEKPKRYKRRRQRQPLSLSFATPYTPVKNKRQTKDKEQKKRNAENIQKNKHQRDQTRAIEKKSPNLNNKNKKDSEKNSNQSDEQQTENIFISNLFARTLTDEEVENDKRGKFAFFRI